MSTEIATLERVKAAVEALHADGVKATADAVLAMIGGGSKPTVLKHLRTLREPGDNQPQSLPINLLEKAKPILGEIFAAGAAAEEARTREQTGRYHRIMADLEAQIDEFQAALDLEQKQNAELTQALATSRDAQAQAAGKLEQCMAEFATGLKQREAEIERLQGELVASRRDQADELGKILETFEARIEGLTLRREQKDEKS